MDNSWRASIFYLVALLALAGCVTTPVEDEPFDNVIGWPYPAECIGGKIACDSDGNCEWKGHRAIVKYIPRNEIPVLIVSGNMIRPIAITRRGYLIEIADDLDERERAQALRHEMAHIVCGKWHPSYGPDGRLIP